jgi:hypothetical protein
MAPALCTHQALVPPAWYHRATATALHLDALPPAAPTGLRLVGGRDARGADLCGGLGRRFGRLAGGPPQSDPLAAAGPGPRLGGGGDM